MQVLFALLLLVVLGCDADKGTPCGPCSCYPGVDEIWKNLDIAKCNIVPGPGEVSQNLEGFWIFGGSITTIVEDQFIYYTKLQQVYIEKNHVQKVESHAFRNMTNMKIIGITDNLIKELPTDIFSDTPNLVELWLQNNNLEVLQSNLFSNLKYLKIVQLHGNVITSIQENCFVNVPSLETLYLNNNKLTDLNLNIMDNPNSLKVWTLYENPWNCELPLCGVIEAVVSRDLRGKWDIPKCVAPQSLRGKRWTDLSQHMHPLITSNVTSVMARNDLTLQCTHCFVSEISWTLNGVKLPRTFQQISTEARTSTLTMKNIHKEEQGNYVCQVNQCPECDTAWVHVTVNTDTVLQNITDQVFQLIHNTTNSKRGVIFLQYSILEDENNNN